MSKPSEPVEVFFSCAEKDISLLEQLEQHMSVLKNEGYISTWHRREITAGTDWQVEIDQHLNTASLILLLISPAFMKSDYHYRVELKRAMERHNENESRVIPILLRPCDYEDAPFEKLKMLPSNHTAVTSWSNSDKAFLDIVRGIRAVLDTAQHLPFPSTYSGVWNVPYRRNSYFTGRDDLLNRLDQQLSSEGQEHRTTMHRAALTQPQAIKGLGGIGKTQIAVEYAYRSRERDLYTHTFWINAASKEALFTSFVALAELLPDFPAKRETDQQKLVKAIIRWMEQCKQRWLLIFDNADDVTLVRDYIPLQGNGSIVLTTRANTVGFVATPVEVETMGFVEGRDFLLRRAQRFEPMSDEEINAARNIVIAFDHFPLALDQAGAYIEETECSFVDYLELYRTHHQELLAKRGILATDYPNSVATTWLLSFQKVKQANPAAAELLCLCSFFAPDHIPEELLKNGVAYWPHTLQQAVADPLKFQQLMSDLLKFSLVKRLVHDKALSIHRLVQVVQKDQMEPETQRQWAERVIRAVNAVFPQPDMGPTIWKQCERLVIHTNTCIAHTDAWKSKNMDLDLAPLLSKTAHYLTYRAQYLNAELLYQREISIYKRWRGLEHIDMALALNNFGSFYVNQGKFEQAEPLLQRSLSVYQRQLGSNHPSTLHPLTNLAIIYQKQGKYEQAEPLFRHVLPLAEQALGPENPELLFPLNSLALFYQEQGKYKQAEPLFQRALRLARQGFSAEHPNVALVLTNLAALYLLQGRYEDAESLNKQALEIRQRQLDANHPDTAFNLNNLASCYQEQGKQKEAEPLFQQALHIWELVLGPEHFNLGLPLNGLAWIYLVQEKFEQAERLFQRSLLIYQQQPGSEHSYKARSLTGLAHISFNQGNFEQAEQLFQHSFSIYERLSPEHPELIALLNVLAHISFNQGKVEQAEQRTRLALDLVVQRGLKPEHPHLIHQLARLTSIYVKQGKFEQELAVYEQILGASHPLTIEMKTALSLRKQTTRRTRRRTYSASSIRRKSQKIYRTRYRNKKE